MRQACLAEAGMQERQIFDCGHSRKEVVGHLDAALQLPALSLRQAVRRRDVSSKPRSWSCSLTSDMIETPTERYKRPSRIRRGMFPPLMHEPRGYSHLSCRYDTFPPEGSTSIVPLGEPATRKASKPPPAVRRNSHLSPSLPRRSSHPLPIKSLINSPIRLSQRTFP